MQQIVPIILAGGAGTRLWPMTRPAEPKQLLRVGGEGSLLAQTLLRFAGDERFSAPIVACSQAIAARVSTELARIGIEPAAWFAEPVKRNTAPAVAVAALLAAQKFGDDVIVAVLPCDQSIGDAAAFKDALLTARTGASQGDIVIIGLVPRSPQTNFGYIEVSAEETHGARKVSRFVEKPDLEAAQRFIASGNHLWNAGIVVARAGTLIAMMENLCQELLAAAKAALASADRDGVTIMLAVEEFSAAPSISFDHAVLEKSDCLAVVPASFAWSDVGTWQGAWDTAERDVNGNAVVGDVVARDCHGSYLRSEGAPLVAIGLEDIVAVRTGQGVLVTARKRAQEVGALVEGVAMTESPAKPVRAHQPWGFFESLATGEGFQVKRLVVKPGGAISLQTHKHRAEHWVVRAGEARVTRGDKVVTLKTGEAIDIPLGALHRLQNEGGETLEIIEVQLGDYLGEDDVVRYGDDYGRS